MKQLTSFIIICSLAHPLLAQNVKETKVPSQVRNGFEKVYPNIKASWEKEQGGYEASFKLKGEKTSVVLSENGTIIETETVIKVSELPAAVKAYVSQKYKQKITEAARIVDAKGEITYEAEIKGKDLIFDSNGHIVREEKHN